MVFRHNDSIIEKVQNLVYVLNLRTVAFCVDIVLTAFLHA